MALVHSKANQELEVSYGHDPQALTWRLSLEETVFRIRFADL